MSAREKNRETLLLASEKQVLPTLREQQNSPKVAAVEVDCWTCETDAENSFRKFQILSHSYIAATGH